MQAQDKKKKKKKKGKCFNCGKEGHFTKECRSKPKQTSEERANRATEDDVEFLFTLQLGGSSTTNGPNTWILDSGASKHMVSSKERLINAEPLGVPTVVVLGDGRRLEATHQGQALIPPNVKLTEVLYVPGLKENLFSISMASAINGVKIVMENGLCHVMKGGEVALSAKKHGGVFRVMAAMATDEQLGKGGDLIDYHRRCGHMNFRTILQMGKMGILPPIREQAELSDSDCQTCMKDKMIRAVIPEQSSGKRKEAGQLIHSDLCGPMRTRSLQGNTYMVT
jgi:hypothetical protein